MAFLYIGTCQARSESSHPNDAQLKLLSWVSPTPDQSFMTRDIAIEKTGMVELKVDGDLSGASGVTGHVFDLQLTPTAAALVEWQTALNNQSPQALLAAMQVTWYVDGEEANLSASEEGPLHWSFYTENPVSYTIDAVVSFPGVNDTYRSNSVTVIVEVENPDEPIDEEMACEDMYRR